MNANHVRILFAVLIVASIFVWSMNRAKERQIASPKEQSATIDQTQQDASDTTDLKEHE